MSTKIYLKDITKTEQTIQCGVHIKNWIHSSKWDDALKEKCLIWLTNTPEIRVKLEYLFENPSTFSTITPLLMYNEDSQEFILIFVDKTQEVEDPGELGSILAYARAYGYDEGTLCSDCYGQLSCSSCAVEIMSGSCKNPSPREEEFDMLDIDNDRPPTQYTRLSCQTVIGEEPLIITIRK